MSMLPDKSALTPEEIEQLQQYLFFIIDGETYGIGIRYVKDIIQIPQQPITPVPFLTDYIRGVINLRGSIVPVIDVRMRFGRSEQEYHERTCVIVVELEDAAVGMVVDSVREVLTLPPESLSRPLKSAGMSENRYVTAIASLDEGKDIVLLLDISRLFYDREMGTDSVGTL